MVHAGGGGGGQVLTGLGFHRDDWTRLTEEFSGGWQMRIALAKLLLQKPTCYCSMSRPTTSILRPATGWRNTLPTIPTRMSCISHDRYFLDVTVTKIVEIWNKQHCYSTPATTTSI